MDFTKVGFVITDADKEPKCWCITCWDRYAEELGAFPISGIRMTLCPDCGNKRCPRATDHNNECTGSNEPGQKGSIYEKIS